MFSTILSNFCMSWRNAHKNNVSRFYAILDGPQKCRIWMCCVSSILFHFENYWCICLYRNTKSSRKSMHSITLWSKLNLSSKRRSTSVFLCTQLYRKSTILSSRVCSQSGVPMGQGMHKWEVSEPLHQQLWIQCKVWCSQPHTILQLLAWLCGRCIYWLFKDSYT